MFVSGAFVLTDTLGRSFDGLFATIYSDTDVGVSAKPKVAIDEFDGESVPANIPAAVLDKVKAVPGVATATGSASADGARVIGRDGKVVTTFGPPRIGENWNGETDLVKLREGRGPTADDEIAINAATAQGGRPPRRRPGRRAHAAAQEDVHRGRDLRLQRRAGLHRRRARGRVHRTGRPAADARPEGRVQQHRRPRRPRRHVAAISCGTPSPPRSARTTRCKTGEQLRAQATDGLKEGLSFFNNVLIGFAGVALFVGIVPHPQHVLDHRGPAHPRTRAHAGARRQPQTGHRLGPDRGRGHRPGRVGPRPGGRHRRRRRARLAVRQRRRQRARAGRRRRAGGRDHRRVRGRHRGHRGRRAAAGAAGLPDPADRRAAGVGHPGPAAHQAHRRRRGRHRGRRDAARPRPVR